MATTLRDDRVNAEFREQLKELTETMRHAVVLLEHLTKGFSDSKSRNAARAIEPLPDLAKVKVIAGDGTATEVIGETGVVLSRDSDNSAGWLYTVLVDSTKETYLLPHQALQFEQKVARESDLYGNTTIAVGVDVKGHGHLVRKSRRR